MNIYLINLDRAQDRLAWFMKRYQSLGVPIVRIAAVDGKKLTEAECQWWSRRADRIAAISHAEIGCFLSHRKAWRAITRSDDDWGFIAEDDVVFHENAAQFIRNSDWLPQSGDIVKAETTGSARIELSAKPLLTVYGHDVSELRSYHGNTAGYFVSKQGAQNLLRLTAETCDPLDELMFNPASMIRKELTIFQLHPAICVQTHNYRGKAIITKRFSSSIQPARTGEDLNAPPAKKSIATRLWLELGRQIGLVRRIAKTLSGRSIFITVPFGNEE